MRIGQTQEQMLARAQFEAAPAPRGQAVHKGEIAWFGIPTAVTLHFLDDRLDRAEFTVEDAAPYQSDYVQDQLRLMGFRRWCEKDDPGYKVCEWRGATLVRLEIRDRRLYARITAAGSAPATPAAPPPRHTPARRDTVPVHPQVFVLGRAAPAGVPASPVLADSTPLVSPALPPAAREAGVQGRVWVRALVDTSGAIVTGEIARGIAELDSAAVEVVRRCRFRPFAPEGVPVRFSVEIPVLFRVRE
jgi:TonB family protein